MTPHAKALEAARRIVDGRGSFADGELVARALLDAGWQPIESAPKDGTPVLLWNKKATMPFVARFADGHWRNNHYGAREPYWYFGAPVWWMPLPSPPEE